ncbi:VOC family protein [Mesorhizobium sp. NPDC059025]|uniref:VOC family protein n=1 Tax=unclassified Mesorhizobium TaxID=325217 RepID=UPI003686399F
MHDPFQHATLGVGVFYRDPWAALEWLDRVFGFRRSMLVTDPSVRLVHCEMRFADAYIVVDHEWADDIASPVWVGGKNTQRVYLKLPAGLDEYCEQARLAGAEILQEPADQFYGERTFRARDLEGHVWTFAQTVRLISREEGEHLSGCSIDGWHRE